MMFRNPDQLLKLGIAALAVAVAAAASDAFAQQAAGRAVQAGVAAAVRGEVKLVSFSTPQAVGRNVASGDAVFLGDRIESGSSAGLQIMLLDETIFTIGPESAIVIDRFVYDPEKSAGKVSASVVRGVFRFVSGRVAANRPSDMEVKLPNGVIGIRGTSAAGIVRPGESQVVLLGPGPENNVGEPGGRIIVSGAGGDVEISRPNFGTVLSGIAAPTAPAQWTPQQMSELNGALRSAPRQQTPNTGPNGTQDRTDSRDGTPGQNPQQQDSGSQTQQQDQSQGGPQTQAQGATPGTGPSALQEAGSAVRAAGQDIGGAVETSGLIGGLQLKEQTIFQTTEGAALQVEKTLSGITTLSQLTQLQSGVFNFGTTHVQFTTNSSYDFSYSIDFGARSHTGSVVMNTATADGYNGNASGTFVLMHDIFSGQVQTLQIQEGGVGTHVPGLNSNSNQITVNYKFVNDGGLATRIEHTVNYQEPAGLNINSASGVNTR